MTEPKNKEIGYAHSFIADLGNGRQISITGNFPVGADAAMMNVEMDKLFGVGNRLQAKAALAGASDEVEQAEFRAKVAKEDIEKHATKHKENKMTVSERTAWDRSLDNLNNLHKEIEYKKTVLERLAKEAA
jgi:hypothetical protein